MIDINGLNRHSDDRFLGIETAMFVNKSGLNFFNLSFQVFIRSTNTSYNNASKLTNMKRVKSASKYTDPL